MHYHKNGYLNTRIDMFKESSQNFAGSCPGYIPRKL